MPADPYSGSKVWKAPDREIGKPGRLRSRGSDDRLCRSRGCDGAPGMQTAENRMLVALFGTVAVHTSALKACANCAKLRSHSYLELRSINLFIYFQRLTVFAGNSRSAGRKGSIPSARTPLLFREPGWNHPGMFCGRNRPALARHRAVKGSHTNVCSASSLMPSALQPRRRSFPACCRT